ncbi:MAG TPA: YqiA/YcfP family alpha/beta fold hydrolase [Thermoanaerobaculia bacterium]
MPADVLYFHGFASSPQSQKLVMLSEMLAPEIILNAPDLNVPTFTKLRFESMIALAEREAARRPPKAIVGSSLGSLVALELVRRGVRAPVVLIAPAVGVARRWHTRLAAGDPVRVFNHAIGGDAEIHRAFFDEMNDVQPELATPPVPVSVVMGREDETVPFEMVRGVWESWTASGTLPAGSRFIEIAGGDHGLVAWVDVIAREIRAQIHVF